MIKGLNFAQPEDQGRMVFVDSDADNLRPGDLLGLPRPARSFGRKNGGAEAESRGRETLAVLVLAQQHATSLDPPSRGRGARGPAGARSNASAASRLCGILILR
jgi:hypothetical protein